LQATAKEDAQEETIHELTSRLKEVFVVRYYCTVVCRNSLYIIRVLYGSLM